MFFSLIPNMHIIQGWKTMTHRSVQVFIKFILIQGAMNALDVENPCKPNDGQQDSTVVGAYCAVRKVWMRRWLGGS